MTSAIKKDNSVTFTPRLRTADPWVNYQLRQAVLRLRREICWLWHERGLTPSSAPDALPSFIDKTTESLNLTRFQEAKQHFWTNDVTASYLTEKLDHDLPARPREPKRGTFAWVAAELKLNDISTFALAVSLLAAFDSNSASIFACCLNDPTQTQPNLRLLQRLWDEPEDVLALADPSHPLFCTGLLYPLKEGGKHVNSSWEAPLVTSPMVARCLLSAGAEMPMCLRALPENGKLQEKGARFVAAGLIHPMERMRVVPLLGARGSAQRELCAAIAHITRRPVYEYPASEIEIGVPDYLNAMATLCWLKGADLLLYDTTSAAQDHLRSRNDGLPAISIPITVFLAVQEKQQLVHIAPAVLQSSIKITPLTYTERLTHWEDELGHRAPLEDDALSDVARRFRYEKSVISKICQGLCALPGKLRGTDLVAACRATLDLEMGELATLVTPRFHDEKLILPHKQELQFAEQIQAMRALGTVHFEWGTADAWNECGLALLFAGPPGTGKTMAAEVMATELDLPLYRIDLSQVVNKYIGETEKNLKRIFDAADMADVILFFDEADALFGRRTEVSDAHDRYANLEISYLLERMERFKGFVILATNRKKDLDEAFLRRLRDIIDFPLPDEVQREAIWRQLIPHNAEAPELDFKYLASQFPMAGGNIRSAIFNACLQSATVANGRKLGMKETLIAIKREYDKINRIVSPEQFGYYADVIAALETQT